MHNSLQTLDPSSSSNPSLHERLEALFKCQQSIDSLKEENYFSFNSLVSSQQLQADLYHCHDSSPKNLKEGSSKKRKAKKYPSFDRHGEDSPEKQAENAAPFGQHSTKSDFIHVRARRGQATDSHSLAERMRREKISERMKYLQGLVPGCTKIAGKAGMLDEIINYVQSLQRQVEFLSMKLANVNPLIDFNIDNLLPKEVILANNPSICPLDAPPFLEPYIHINPTLHQIDACLGLNTNIDFSYFGFGMTLGSPVNSIFDTSFNVMSDEI